MTKCLNINYLKEKAKSPLDNSPRLRARRILRILKRDDYKCSKCGKTENLTIHHPNGREFSKWDNASKYKIKKCITLCVNCHRQIHKQTLNINQNDKL